MGTELCQMKNKQKSGAVHMDIKDVKEVFEANRIKTVIVGGTDPGGVMRGKRLTVPYFYSALDHGFNFAMFILCTTPVDDVLPGLFDGGVPDIKGVPDLSTLRLAPWEEDAAIVLMDWHGADGEPLALCPRSELKRQVARVREMGLEEVFALEFEFFLMPKPISEIRAGGWNDLSPPSQDIHCYSIYEGHFAEPIVSRIRAYFEDEVEGCTPEWGQGQFEINLHRSDAVAMADTLVLFKIAVKQLAAQAGLSATFMAKWHEDYSGNSGHIHQSLKQADSGASAFYDESERYRMSKLFQHYLAGQLDVMRPATLFFAPFVNSYKRFQLDSFAGVTKTWAIDNRTAALRVLNYEPEKCRLENRIGGADLNPYLASAVSLGAGLRGIEQELPLQPPGEGNCYHLPDVETVPMSLTEALREAEASAALREVIAPELVDNMVNVARFETSVFDTRVTDLERRRYFEMV
jgi:glutamine synthetase